MRPAQIRLYSVAAPLLVFMPVGFAFGEIGAFLRGPEVRLIVAELLTQAAERPTAIMCSEGDHRHCHRYTLLTPVLLDLDTRVLHIQPDGSLVDEEEEPRQLALF